MMLTRQVRYTGFIKCGSNPTAISLSLLLRTQGGCLQDLFAWVEVTVGAGTNGLAQARNF